MTYDIVQIVGALLVLSGFAAQQFGMLASSSYPYLIVNFFGSAILAVLAVIDSQWGFLILEGSWALVSAWSLIGRLRGAERRAATP